MEALSYLAYIPILVAIYIATIYFVGKLQKLPPSPFLCFPIIGHLYLMMNPASDANKNLVNRHGPLVFLWFGSRPAILVSSPSLVEECLNKNDIVFCNRPTGSLFGKYRGYDFTSLNFSPYGPHRRNLRKIATVEMLSLHRLQSLAAVRSDELRLLLKQLSGSSDVTVMRPHIFDTALNMMTRMLFGERYYGSEACSDKARRIREFVVESIALASLVNIGDDIPYLRRLDRGREKRFQEYKEKRDTLMMELIDEHRTERREMNSNNVDTKVKPVIQSLLELQESNPEYYQDQVLHSLITDLLIGSSETTTNTVEWALSLLLNNPKALKKARSEIDNHIGNVRLLEESDLNNLPYLRCILNETLRMYPPLPFLFPHESSKDCVVGGYRIPRGTFLLINVNVIQNDPKIWDSPRTFRPERFEGVEGHRLGYKMMPFGSGRRSCPGEGLAIRVIAMIVGTLIQCFDLERIGDELVDMPQLDTFDMQKAVPLTARIKLRQVMVNLLKKL